MQYKIRRAVRGDCTRMMELVHELALFERAPQEVTVTLDHFIENGFGPQKVWEAFVAEKEEFIGGFALYYIRYSTWKGTRLYLEDIIVTEPLRGMGIGSLLFERCLEESRMKGYSGMSWQVLDWNEPAIKFYQKYPGVIIDKGWLNFRIENIK